MSIDVTSPLERLLRECGLGWAIDSYDPHEGAVSFFRDTLTVATHESRSRFGHSAPVFSEETLMAEYDRNPHKVTAFLQALVSIRSPQMLVMAWRVLQGVDIQAIDMSYENLRKFDLRITLSPSEGESPEVYESTDVFDATVLRHFGLAKANEQPLFDGFYPLRLSDREA